jgi:hypothetical protein
MPTSSVSLLVPLTIARANPLNMSPSILASTKYDFSAALSLPAQPLPGFQIPGFCLAVR